MRERERERIYVINSFCKKLKRKEKKKEIANIVD